MVELTGIRVPYLQVLQHAEHVAVIQLSSCQYGDSFILVVQIYASRTKNHFLIKRSAFAFFV